MAATVTVAVVVQCQTVTMQVVVVAVASHHWKSWPRCRHLEPLQPLDWTQPERKLMPVTTEEVRVSCNHFVSGELEDTAGVVIALVSALVTLSNILSVQWQHTSNFHNG